MSRTRLTTLPFLLWSYHNVLFEIDFVSALYLEYPLDISMVLGRNIEQDQSTCGVQE